MATPQPTDRMVMPPPDLPYDPKISETLTQYLRTFALWCRNGFADKLSGTVALPGVMLIGYDTAGNPTNATYMLTVKNGAVTLTQIAAGQGKP